MVFLPSNIFTRPSLQASFAEGRSEAQPAIVVFLDTLHSKTALQELIVFFLQVTNLFCIHGYIMMSPLFMVILDYTFLSVMRLEEEALDEADGAEHHPSAKVSRSKSSITSRFQNHSKKGRTRRRTTVPDIFVEVRPMRHLLFLP